MALLRWRRSLRGLTTSVTGTLMADESYLGQTWSATAATGQRRVRWNLGYCCLACFPPFPLFLETVSAWGFKRGCGLANGASPGATVGSEVWPLAVIYVTGTKIFLQIVFVTLFRRSYVTMEIMRIYTNSVTLAIYAFWLVRYLGLFGNVYRKSGG